MPLRGIRGAITVDHNTAEAILSATRELLEHIVAANGLDLDDIASVIFTATGDLDAAYPAVVAREMGWAHIPLLCMQEMRVEGSLPRCIRTLIHWNTERTSKDVQHIYLREAQKLRPDLVKRES